MQANPEGTRQNPMNRHLYLGHWNQWSYCINEPAEFLPSQNCHVSQTASQVTLASGHD